MLAELAMNRMPGGQITVAPLFLLWSVPKDHSDRYRNFKPCSLVSGSVLSSAFAVLGTSDTRLLPSSDGRKPDYDLTLKRVLLVS